MSVLKPKPAAHAGPPGSRQSAAPVNEEAIPTQPSGLPPRRKVLTPPPLPPSARPPSARRSPSSPAEASPPAASATPAASQPPLPQRPERPPVLAVDPASSLSAKLEQHKQLRSSMPVDPASSLSAKLEQHKQLRPSMPVDPASSLSAKLEQHKQLRPSMGFSALFEKTSLREWVRRIEATGCDAVVSVLTADQQRGQLWCAGGNVIDAEWGALTGEDAAHQILALHAGDVSVKFGPVERRRRIVLPTRELLYAAARRLDRRALSRTQYDILSQNFLATGVVRVPAQLRSTLVPQQLKSTLVGASTRTLVSQPSAPPPPPKADTSTYLAGALAVVTLAAIGAGLSLLTSAPKQPLVAPQPVEQAPPEQVKAALVPAPLATIEVEPRSAEIWLDSTRIGVGRVLQAPVRDGLVHQLRFVAPGYGTRSVFFRETAPTGRMVLQPEKAPRPASAR